MPVKITAFLGIILLVIGVFCGCSPGKEYVGGLDEKLSQTEKVEDNALVQSLNNAATAWALDQSLHGRDADTLTWHSLKKELDQKDISYLESLGEESFSDKTLATSIRDKGWIKVRQGWISISKGDEFDFSYNDGSPDS
jgi:hypothetical protein